MMNSHLIASGQFNDLPTSTDLLGTHPYAEALASYIAKCATPLTVAIQGDWGSGKTSTMNMIKDQQAVKEAAMVIDFNTWQYSQFNMSESLVLALMAHMIEKISDENSEDTDSNLKKTKLLRSISKFLTSSAIAATDEVSKLVPFAQIFMAGAKEGIASLDEKTSEELEFQRLEEMQNVAKIVENLRGQIEEYVTEALKAKGLDRMIVFIDDLDRLDPERAVEVLEAIKVFLDVDRCIYVLAIDFDVVEQGVRRKFGSDINERKARAFFDKIIQLPFHLPVNTYKIDDLLGSVLRINSQDKRLKEYVSLSQFSVGNNPRSLKRLAHTFTLIREIIHRKNNSERIDDELALRVFAVLCMQSAFPRFHREFEVRAREATLSESRDDLIDSFIASIIDPPKENDSSSRSTDTQWEEWGVLPLDIGSFRQFISLFQNLFTNDSDNDQIDLEKLNDAMQLGSITSIGQALPKTQNDSRITFGLDNVIATLKERDVNNEDLSVFEQIARTLLDTFGAEKFDVGIGSTPEAKFYANPNAESLRKRGAIAEIRFHKNGFAVKMARNSLNTVSPGITKEWYDRFKEKFTSHSYIDDEKCAEAVVDNYRIYVSKIRNPSEEQIDLLLKILEEARDVVAKRL